MSEPFKFIRYEGVEDGVATIALARADKRNAQNKTMLYELNDALDLASHDDDCKVIVLTADGPDFSSGHDMKDREPMDHKPVGTWGGFRQPGIEGHWSYEEELYLGFCWRWRNIPKPTMVAVQGRVIAGGLMLVWPFDIIIAADNARFSDPVVAFGVNGVEYFAHPWEVGVRKAKEMLFTGEALTAEEGKALGMVNHVVPEDELTEFTMNMAKHIAKQPMVGLKLAKQSVNQMQDGQGLWPSLQAAMSLQHMGHAHERIMHQRAVEPEGEKKIRKQAKKSESNQFDE
ncbi:MAG: enoyl-CoA hydratase [Pseudomonadales bacterium]|nr:enoyl-CoA hydratase [Pseudomonadales bacterium]MBO6565440.1 enoyl-CoA hydratase [Pseudomonadales bacterium]MBO6596785.1 enoyl-CoA hydratase [Pseudomonadales bacterium]MBO6703455.1 enoyl-CoA hydratase [Pseudomonadales bacterium]MBO6823226.1 enoyl-CoA hydratase [Pseudomonadales bacterium]